MIIQNNKQNTMLVNRLTLQYVSRSFPADHSSHQRSEPMVPYNVDLYSTGYPRGNEITLEQYLDHAHAKQDSRLLNAIAQNLKINLVFHKPELPVFCKASGAVTITVTSEQEKNWLYKTLWSKHFKETDDAIHFLPKDPDYCNFSSLVPVLTYNEPYLFSKDSKKELYNKHVINDHTNPWYFDPKKFHDYDKQNQINNIFIRLEDLLDRTKFLGAVSHVFEYHKLGTPDMTLLANMHEIWLNRQIPYEL